jgi:energy-converting hydrogenase Eha subunit H
MLSNMSKRKKIMLGISIVLLILLIVVILIFNIASNNNKDTEEDVKGYNTNKGIVGDKEVKGITFTDIECKLEEEETLISYKITNTTNKIVNIGEYELVIKDKDGQVLTTVVPNLDYELKSNEVYEMSNSININLEDGYEIEFNLDNMK